MTPTVSIDVPADREALVRSFLAMAEELDHLALSAPDGTVFDACETAVVLGGRDLQARVLEAAVARRVAAAEKKGPRSATARAGVPARTAGRRAADS